MSWIKRNWGFVVAALIIAAIVHVASVIAIPHLVMGRVISVMAQNGGLNTMKHGARATARSRLVVRPSPDLLYSTCIFDLNAAGGALRVHASGMPATYWSVSIFDAETNNFFVENDRQAKTGAVDFILIAPGVSVGDVKLPMVVSPTMRGVILFRTLINNETRLAEIDASRRHASCEPYARR